jgi:hypothetical protein
LPPSDDAWYAKPTTTSAPSAPAGDGWATNVGFVSPLPFVTPGHYTATVTFTVIGR